MFAHSLYTKTKTKTDMEKNRDKVEKRTINLDDSEIERMPDTGDDYRLPRELPEEQQEEKGAEGTEDSDDLIDNDIDISPGELALLEEAERNASSDESIASDLLDNTDEDGDELNEGPDEDSLFDTGEDLDMPNSVNNPDIDADDEEN
jgi:hypothetical protein